MGTESIQEHKVVRLSERLLSMEELVAGLKERDLHAAHVLYERYGDLVNRLVWRMLGADSEHDDVVQQVFVNVFGSICSIKDPGALSSWLTGVAANTVRRELRNRKYRRWLHPRLERSEDEYCRDATGRGVVVVRVYELLRELKAEQQIYLTLRYMEGLTLSELAAARGCSLATVKRRMARARMVFMRRASRDAILAAWFEESSLGD